MFRNLLFLGIYVVVCALAACSSSYQKSGIQGEGGTYGRLDDAKDVPKPRDAKIIYQDSAIYGDQDTWVGRLSYTCSENTSYMWDFLHNEMPKMGWSQISAVRAKSSLLVFKKGTRVATLQLHSRLLGSRVTCDVTPEISQGGPIAGAYSTPEDISPNVTMQPLE